MSYDRTYWHSMQRITRRFKMVFSRVLGGTVLAAFGAGDGTGYYKVIEGLLINSLQRELQGARSDLVKKWGRGDSL